MSNNALRRGLEQIRAGVERTIRSAAARHGRGGSVNIARRTNVIVTGNLGESGAVHAASAMQDAPIVQSGRSEQEQREEGPHG